MTIDRSQFQMRARTMPEHLANCDKLVPGSLRGAKFAVVTITDAVQVDASRGEDRRGQIRYEPAVVLAYSEFPKRIHWLNKSGVNILCDVFGDDEKQWVGNRIPIIVQEDVKNRTTGDTQDMVWVANADEWERLFAENDDALSKTTAKPMNAAAAMARAAAEKRKAQPRSQQ